MKQLPAKTTAKEIREKATAAGYNPCKNPTCTCARCGRKALKFWKLFPDQSASIIWCVCGNKAKEYHPRKEMTEEDLLSD